MLSRFNVIVLLFVIALLPNDLSAQETKSEFKDIELPPVKRIVLYNSGVGQLQHEGEVDGNQKVTLKFSAHDVSDALKSLAISDDGEGHVRAIEYQPAPDPEDIAANDIGQPMTVAQLIQSMRGESIVLTAGDKTVTGQIFGVENRTQGDVTREMVVLIGDKGMSSYELAKFESIRFEKAELNEQIVLALGGIVKSRQSDQKELQLLFEGDKKRNVKFAYVVDMPIWRMTYRLMWENNKAHLQGWAHVDNVSGVDWTDVALELRSGKPTTFHTNVFAPAMAQRKNIGTSAYEFMAGLAITTQWFGFPPAKRFSSEGDSRGRTYGGGFGGGGFGGGGLGGGGVFGRAQPGEGDEADGVDARTGFENSAETEKVSQMVVYRISDPVSLGSGKSAALPAFEMELPGTLLSIADLANRGGDVTPVQAIELENDTDFSLLSGPISIMQKGSFSGDGKLPRVDVKQKAYVDFGVDRSVKARQTKEESSRELLKVTRDKDNLLHTYRHSRTVTMRVVNLDVDDRTVLLKTGREESQEGSIVPEPYRRTDDRLVFKVEAKAGETTLQTVTFSYVDVSSSSWIEYRKIDTTRWDAAGVSLPEKDLALMKKVAEINRKIDIEREASFKWLQKRRNVETEQKRIRENLKVFVPGSKDAEPIIAQFTKLEKTIAELDEKIEIGETAMRDLKSEKQDLLK
jgi:uncharacterized membrane protein YgcG